MPTEHEWAVERRRCLVRELLRLTRERGTEWLEQFVKGCKWWKGVRGDFVAQRRAGNIGKPGDWR
jgi:hypothetical protein